LGSILNFLEISVNLWRFFLLSFCMLNSRHAG
jgi:hypothetical protein